VLLGWDVEGVEADESMVRSNHRLIGRAEALDELLADLSGGGSSGPLVMALTSLIRGTAEFCWHLNIINPSFPLTVYGCLSCYLRRFVLNAINLLVTNL
jgi:hypothetical protein